MPSLGALAAIGLGAAIAAAAVPVAVSDLLAMPGDSILKRLQDERAVGEHDLRRFIRSREAAAQWRSTARAYTDIALGRLILGGPPGRRTPRPESGDVEALLTKGLGLAPMNPYGWMRLAQVRMAREAAGPDIAPPLRLALRSGPHEDRRHAMLLLMVEAGLGAWNELNGPERRLIEAKANAAWERDARGAAAAAVRAGRAELLARLLGF